ncbi:hypothetical protein GOB98_24400 [Sinorhizobium meliloti]|nr:hypothetical protein [Sinorhizobium meliloti]MDW9979163.1 hypothetical protein [Sinorhizobium meliloti]MDX0295671.1 hypothetical protein [Sinorhizobium meliloti]
MKIFQGSLRSAAAGGCVYRHRHGNSTPPQLEALAAASFLISVLVTEIQQRRVCGAGRVLSDQGLGYDPYAESRLSA